MNRRRIAALLLASQSLASCGEERYRPAANSGIEPYGLHESVVDHPLVFAAIEKANVILKTSGQKFAPGWMPERESTAIPVHAVRGQLASNEIITTYQECRCVIVQFSAFDAWIKAKVGSGSALLEVEPRLIISYMLLHEAGHVVRDGSIEIGFPYDANTSASGFNRDLTAQKERESAADLFAAEAIHSALSEGQDRGLAATELAMALSKLSWNLAAHRLLDDFGGTGLNKPALFWDAGTSHPNLEWRILVVNDHVERTETSRKLLADFESARLAGSNANLRLPVK